MEMINCIKIIAARNCEVTPCLNGGTCQQLMGSFKCTCAPGYIGSTCNTGKFVQIIFMNHRSIFDMYCTLNSLNVLAIYLIIYKHHIHGIVFKPIDLYLPFWFSSLLQFTISISVVSLNITGFLLLPLYIKWNKRVTLFITYQMFYVPCLYRDQRM